MLKHETTKKCSKVVKKGQKVKQRQSHPHVIDLAKQTTISNYVNCHTIVQIPKELIKLKKKINHKITQNVTAR